MLPEGWQSQTLEYLASVQRGRFSPRPRNDPRYYGGLTPFVQTGDVTLADKYLTRFSQSLNDDGVRVSKVFPPGTILMTIAANIGHTAITTFDCACPDSVVGIQARPDRCDVLWLKAVLETKRDALDGLATQNAQKNINLEVLKPLSLRTPPLPEQRKIAQVLSTWDRAITTVEELIANARAQKAALMQQLLTGKERLADFSGAWRSIRLGQALEERSDRGLTHYPLLSVTMTRGIVSQGDVGRKNISTTDLSNYKAVCPGDIAYNTMRMWQGASALSSLTGIVSPAYTVLKARSGHCPRFYSYLFKLPSLVHVFERHSQGLVSDTWNLKYPLFSKIKVAVPEEGEQRAISDRLLSADGLIAQTKAHAEFLRREKSALMQQLLTGKRRVPIETHAEPLREAAA